MAEKQNVFLRWARLKQAAKERLNAEDAATNEGEAVAPRTADPASDEPFDLASLPPIESIDAKTDLAVFLRAGIPAELTRAALRRAWSSDPAIRDFIGIAENQWDFNDPNGIPGFGPLDSTKTVDDFLAQVSRRLKQIPDTLVDATSPIDPPAAADFSEPLLDRRRATGEPSLANATGESIDMQDTGAPREQEPIEEAQDAPRRRRHGSALPR